MIMDIIAQLSQEYSVNAREQTSRDRTRARGPSRFDLSVCGRARPPPLRGSAPP